MLRRAAVKGQGNRLAGDCRHMLRAVTEIDHPLERLRESPATASVSVIVRHRRVEMPEAIGHGCVTNRAGRATGTLAAETFVPRVDWHPNFEVDVGLPRRSRE